MVWPGVLANVPGAAHCSLQEKRNFFEGGAGQDPLSIFLAHNIEVSLGGELCTFIPM